jgi:ABC-type Fe3+/spermidine/putrescine transport system ATPase subunit
MGAANFFTAEAREASEERLGLRLPSGMEIEVPAPPFPVRPGETVRFLVRPEKLALQTTLPPEPGLACVPVTVEDRVYQGVSTLWMVRGPGGERFVAYEQNATPLVALPPLPAGASAFLCWNPQHTVIMR